MIMDEEYDADLQESLQRTLDAFYEYLSEKQGLKEETVNRHMGRISFFGQNYLRNYVGDSIEDFHSDQIIDFLGDFYIRKVLNSTERDVGPYLTTFKKFAKFLKENENLDRAELDEINMVCKQRDYFKHRFKTYFASDDIEAWYFDNDLYQYLDDMESADQSEEEDTIDIDLELVDLLEERDFETPIAVRAFSAFLEKIQNEKSVKLTSSRQHITRRFWQELAQAADLDVFTKPTLNQEDIGLFHFFFLAGKHYRLFRINGNKLEPTDLLEVYQQKLTDKDQYSLLIDALWNQLYWREVQPSNVGGRIEITQSKRANVAALLSQYPVEKEVKLREDPLGLKLAYETVFGGVTDHFLKYIMPIMEYFGLFQLKLWFSDDDEQRYIGIDSITINSFGIFIFNQLKKMGNDLPEGALVNPMSEMIMQLGLNTTPVIKEKKVGRNDPCPCGSGKKYKKCCM